MFGSISNVDVTKGKLHLNKSFFQTAAKATNRSAEGFGRCIHSTAGFAFFCDWWCGVGLLHQNRHPRITKVLHT